MKPTLLASALSLTLGMTLAGQAMAEFQITRTGHFAETCSDEGCTEISDYSHSAQRLYVTNGTDNKLRILGMDSEGVLTPMDEIDLAPYGGGPNSVAVYGDWVAVAVEADDKQENGQVVVFNLDGEYQTSVEVGALPDMLTFTPDGAYLLVANEGEPNDDYTDDPEGSVSVIDTGSWSVATADFHAFNDPSKMINEPRIFGPGASVAQDLEPEYIAVSSDSKTAWITLQENNAIAILDIENAEITTVKGLGYKDHMDPRNRLDVSDKDDIDGNLKRWPVLGMYQPDALTTFAVDDQVYVLTANEGDARDYDGFSEEDRVKDLTLDETAFADYDIESLQSNENLGRLNVTNTLGDTDGDGDFDKLYAYGARSFSIWTDQVDLEWDSGAQFEQHLSRYAKQGLDVWEEGRSDNKGPEPEAVVVGELAGNPYAFIGLERTSGVFIYDLKTLGAVAKSTGKGKGKGAYAPQAAGFMDLEEMGDVAPEGLKFIPNGDSGWLVVTSEVSSTVSVYKVSVTD